MRFIELDLKDILTEHLKKVEKLDEIYKIDEDSDHRYIIARKGQEMRLYRIYTDSSRISHIEDIAQKEDTAQKKIDSDFDSW